MPGALYNYVKYGCGVQAFPVDRDGWSRREESGPISSGSTTRVSITGKITTPSISPPSPKRPSQQGDTHVKFKETPENRAPRMRTHAEIKAAKIKREQRKKIASTRVIQGYARKWLDRNTIHILRRRLVERDEQLSMKKKENKELKKELHRVYRAVDPSKKAIGRVQTLKHYQQVSGLVEKALSKKRTSRWGLTKGERLVVAQKAVNKKY